jgi:hypothetical protein
MINPYIRLDFTPTGGDGATEYRFKGVSASATSLVNRLSTYINSVQVDNVQNADQVYDALFSHSTSADWLSHDGQILMRSGLVSTAGDMTLKTIVMPLIGSLGTQQGIPLFALNGTLQVQLDYNTLARALYKQNVDGAAITGFTISNVQLVYDKISVEQAFVDKVKSDMAQGRKYVLGYTNFQSTTIATLNGTAFFNYGVNVSSLRALVGQQLLTADLSGIGNGAAGVAFKGKSAANGLSQFQVSLDGRLINSNTLNAASNPALVFAELNKCFSRLFDASITDISTGADYLTQSFAVGVSAQRCNEALAFAGSPVSVVGVNFSTTSADYTMFLTFISDYQVLIDASGAVEIVR